MYWDFEYIIGTSVVSRANLLTKKLTKGKKLVPVMGSEISCKTEKKERNTQRKKCWNKRKRWYLYNKQKNIIEMYTKNKKKM